MKHNQLALCCCWLLFATGCDDGSGQAGLDVPLLGSTDRHDAMSRFVQDFMEVPLEGSDEASDSCAYRNHRRQKYPQKQFIQLYRFEHFISSMSTVI